MAATLGGCGLGQRMWVNMSVGPDGGHARWVKARVVYELKGGRAGLGGAGMSVYITSMHIPTML